MKRKLSAFFARGVAQLDAMQLESCALLAMACFAAFTIFAVLFLAAVTLKASLMAVLFGCGSMIAGIWLVMAIIAAEEKMEQPLPLEHVMLSRIALGREWKL